jgi:beta-barrel assembly-enhancing protease
MDSLEKNLKSSGLLVRDPELNNYIHGIVCRVAGAHCADIRVYVVRIPEFNASMAPNGVMQVWTGLLLRAENEAQVAYIIGHELGHYLRRHSLQMWRDLRQKSSLFAYFNLLTLVVGVPGYVHDITQLATLGSLFKFSRDSEREADQLGFELTTGAGYDPREAGKLWEALLKERDAAKDPTPWVFFSTHPPTKERIATLNRLADEFADKHKPEIIGKEPYLATVGPWRGMLLRDELQQRQFARSQVLLDRLLGGNTRSGEFYYFQGELHRLRGEEGNEEQAKAAYHKALQYEDVPTEAYRELGLLYLKSGQNEQAQTFLRRYIQLKPQAEDRAMISTYLDTIEGSTD